LGAGLRPAGRRQVVFPGGTGQRPVSLTAKPFCESLKLEIEVSPDLAARIAALLAAL
jgi:hypothetical protein